MQLGMTSSIDHMKIADVPVSPS